MVKQFQRTETREFVILLDLPPRSRKQNGSSDKSSTVQETQDDHDEDLAVEFVASIAQHVCASNHAVLTVAIADQKETLALRVQTRTQTHALHERLGLARAGDHPTFTGALHLLEREIRHVDHLLVVSTRPQPFSFSSQDGMNDSGQVTIDAKGQEDAPIVFWRHMMWINVANKELSPYFQPAP
jgi:VCBS repeat-containing protein